MAKSRICSIPDCDKPTVGRGWCRYHYKRWYHRGDPLAPDARMKAPRQCAVEGCSKTSRISGWCVAHYTRNRRHGAPLAGGTPHGDPERFLTEVVLLYDGDECLIWPFLATDAGRACISIHGHPKIVSRVVCEYVNGPPPTPDHESAHSCGRGHLGCVSPRHVRWATHSENMQDAILHGTSARGERNGCAKVTENQVREIRALKGTLRLWQVAENFGISQTQVWAIQNRTAWAWLD